MVKKYNMINVNGINSYHCRLSGVGTETFDLEPGIYTFTAGQETPHHINYTNRGGIIRMPKIQVRSIAKTMGEDSDIPEKIYVRWDGETLHVIRPSHALKVMLDIGYHIRTREFLDKQENLAQMSLDDLFIENGIRLIIHSPGEVYADENFENIYKDISCLSEEGMNLFIKIRKNKKNGETMFEPITGFNE